MGVTGLKARLLTICDTFAEEVLGKFTTVYCLIVCLEKNKKKSQLPVALTLKESIQESFKKIQDFFVSLKRNIQQRADAISVSDNASMGSKKLNDFELLLNIELEMTGENSAASRQIKPEDLNEIITALETDLNKVLAFCLGEERKQLMEALIPKCQILTETAKTNLKKIQDAKESTMKKLSLLLQRTFQWMEKNAELKDFSQTKSKEETPSIHKHDHAHVQLKLENLTNRIRWSFGENGANPLTFPDVPVACQEINDISKDFLADLNAHQLASLSYMHKILLDHLTSNNIVRHLSEGTNQQFAKETRGALEDCGSTKLMIEDVELGMLLASDSKKTTEQKLKLDRYSKEIDCMDKSLKNAENDVKRFDEINAKIQAQDAIDASETEFQLKIEAFDKANLFLVVKEVSQRFSEDCEKTFMQFQVLESYEQTADDKDKLIKKLKGEADLKTKLLDVMWAAIVDSIAKCRSVQEAYSLNPQSNNKTTNYSFFTVESRLAFIKDITKLMETLPGE